MTTIRDLLETTRQKFINECSVPDFIGEESQLADDLDDLKASASSIIEKLLDLSAQSTQPLNNWLVTWQPTTQTTCQQYLEEINVKVDYLQSLFSREFAYEDVMFDSYFEDIDQAIADVKDFVGTFSILETIFSCLSNEDAVLLSATAVKLQAADQIVRAKKLFSSRAAFLAALFINFCNLASANRNTTCSTEVMEVLIQYMLEVWPLVANEVNARRVDPFVLLLKRQSTEEVHMQKIDKFTALMNRSLQNPNLVDYTVAFLMMYMERPSCCYPVCIQTSLFEEMSDMLHQGQILSSSVSVYQILARLVQNSISVYGSSRRRYVCGLFHPDVDPSTISLPIWRHLQQIALLVFRDFFKTFKRLSEQNKPVSAKQRLALQFFTDRIYHTHVFHKIINNINNDSEGGINYHHYYAAQEMSQLLPSFHFFDVLDRIQTPEEMEAMQSLFGARDSRCNLISFHRWFQQFALQVYHDFKEYGTFNEDNLWQNFFYAVFDYYKYLPPTQQKAPEMQAWQSFILIQKQLTLLANSNDIQTQSNVFPKSVVSVLVDIVKTSNRDGDIHVLIQFLTTCVQRLHTTIKDALFRPYLGVSSVSSNNDNNSSNTAAAAAESSNTRISSRQFNDLRPMNVNEPVNFDDLVGVRGDDTVSIRTIMKDHDPDARMMYSEDQRINSFIVDQLIDDFDDDEHNEHTTNNNTHNNSGNNFHMKIGPMQRVKLLGEGLATLKPCFKRSLPSNLAILETLTELSANKIEDYTILCDLVKLSATVSPLELLEKLYVEGVEYLRLRGTVELRAAMSDEQTAHNNANNDSDNNSNNNSNNNHRNNNNGNAENVFNNAAVVRYVYRNLNLHVERQIANVKFSATDILRALLQLNPVSLKVDEVNTAESIGEAFVQFMHDNNTFFEQPLLQGHIDGVQCFQNNQVAALFLLYGKPFGIFQPRPTATTTANADTANTANANVVDSDNIVVMKVGTGQGKTLVEVCTALRYLRFKYGPSTAPSLNTSNNSFTYSASKGRVWVLTSFVRLAERDHRQSTRLVHSMGYKSCCLVNATEENLKQALKSHIIFTDSDVLIDLVRNVSNRWVLSTTEAQFLKMMHDDWSEDMVILDEIDVIAEKDEARLIYNHLPFFVSNVNNNTNDTVASTWVTSAAQRETFINTTLQQDDFHRINQHLGLSASYFSSITEDTRDTHGNQSDQSFRYVGSLRHELLQKGVFNVSGSAFSMKWKLASVKHIVGFSGTVNNESIRECLQFLPRAIRFYEIPLFFAPGRRYGDIHCHVCRANEATQLPWLRAAIEQNALPDFPCDVAMQSVDDWCQEIKLDVEEAQSRNQPTVIFVANQPEKIERLKTTLSIQGTHVYNTQDKAHDDVIQAIALPRNVSICTKLIGRGANIRVLNTEDMPLGLHVICGSVDYREEILQQIGRTGRMNRKGSFSIIFHKDDVIPEYRETDRGTSFKRQVKYAHEISCMIYRSSTTIDWTIAKRLKVAWFLSLMMIGSCSRFNAGDSNAWLASDKTFLRSLLGIAIGP